MVDATIGGGLLLSKIRYWFPLYLIGTVCSLVGTIFLYFSTIDTSVARICVFGGRLWTVRSIGVHRYRRQSPASSNRTGHGLSIWPFLSYLDRLSVLQLGTHHGKWHGQKDPKKAKKAKRPKRQVAVDSRIFVFRYAWKRFYRSFLKCIFGSFLKNIWSQTMNQWITIYRVSASAINNVESIVNVGSQPRRIHGAMGEWVKHWRWRHARYSKYSEVTLMNTGSLERHWHSGVNWEPTVRVFRCEWVHGAVVSTGA